LAEKLDDAILKCSKKTDNLIQDNEIENSAISCSGKRPRFTERQNSVVGIEDNFPFRSIADFMPTFNSEEVTFLPKFIA